jgi:hypothetical protein
MAVADEVRRVLGPHQPLAQQPAAQLLGAGQGLGRRLCPGHDLHQLQVARRIEEVGDAEALLEVGRAVGHQVADAQPRGVGRHDGLAAQRLQARVQLLLDGQVLDDGLDDHVALGRGGQIVLEVADPDQGLEARRQEGRRLGLLRLVQPVLGDAVARPAIPGRGVLWGNVQQQHLEARVRQVGGDRGPHHTGAQHGHLVNGFAHGSDDNRRPLVGLAGLLPALLPWG